MNSRVGIMSGGESYHKTEAKCTVTAGVSVFVLNLAAHGQGSNGCFIQCCTSVNIISACCTDSTAKTGSRKTKV